MTFAFLSILISTIPTEKILSKKTTVLTFKDSFIVKTSIEQIQIFLPLKLTS